MKVVIRNAKNLATLIGNAYKIITKIDNLSKHLFHMMPVKNVFEITLPEYYLFRFKWKKMMGDLTKQQRQ